MIAWQKPFRAAVLYLLCLLLLALPLAAQDDGYVEIGGSELATLSLYMPSVEVREHYSGDYVVGWIKLDLSDDELDELKRARLRGMPNIDSLATMMWFYAANIGARQTQVLSVALYNKEGRKIISDSENFYNHRWKECVPGTADEAIWQVLMEAAGYE